MTTPRTAADFLAANDLPGLLAFNAALFGDATNMARGINALGDVITLADGTDLNQVWNELQQTIELQNTQRTALLNLIAGRTTRASDVVLQTPLGTARFEAASEFGVPTSLRAETATVYLGYPLDWYDLGSRMTYRFLADATSQQVASLHNVALEADNLLQHNLVLNALFGNVNRTSDSTDAPIKALWNGDGSPIPPFAGNTFNPATYSMYHTTGTASLTDPKDVEEMIAQPMAHGYGEADGATMVVLANRQEADIIAGWRAGVGGAAFDFIPSDTSVPYLTQEILVGQRPPGEFQGLKVSGQYGHALIVPTHLIPPNYMAAVAVGGPAPVVGLREHARLTGLQIIRGSNPDYPIIEAYYAHAAGAGVRSRGAAAIRQVTASGTYTPPVFA